MAAWNAYRQITSICINCIGRTRSVNCFGTQNYHHIADEDTVPIEETLSILADFITAGKIVISAYQMKSRGALRNSCALRRNSICRVWSASRIRTACLTALLKLAIRNSPTVNKLVCWLIHRWHSAYCRENT